MAKRIRVSDDNGVTWWTLPGNTGDKRAEASVNDDTIFGQNYTSEQPGLIAGMITSNGILKGYAGYQATLKRGGTPIVMTDEAMTLVSGKTYQITAATKRIIDLATPIVVEGNNIAIAAANILNIDYLNGTVTFQAAYTPTAPITITGAYVPTAVMASGRTFTLNQTAAEVDDTTYEVAQANNGQRTYDQGLKQVRLEVGGIKNASNTFMADLLGRTMIYVDISPQGDGNHFFRGFFKPHNDTQQGNNGALEEENVTLGLYVPEGDLIKAPFAWTFPAGTAMSKALRVCLEAWQNGTVIGVQYLPDGTNGQQNLAAIVTEATLANTMEGLNEFRFSMRPSGAMTAVGTG